jgi:hypothetical protein
MMHLTATTTQATAHRRASVSRPAIGRHGRQKLPPASSPRHLPKSLGSVSSRHIANFVEISSASFHYSVIDRRAMDALGGGYVGRCPLKDDVPASKSRLVVSAVRTKLSCSELTRRKLVLCQRT